MKHLSAKFQDLPLPTYSPKAAEPLPMFFEKKPYQGASGHLYPIPFCNGITDEKTDKVYRAAVLENEYIRVEVLPELGGKIQRAYDKKNGFDFVYHNKVIKPAMVGIAGPWISGGVEFNWPQHHRPTHFAPLEATVEEKDGEGTVWTGETDPLYRMRGFAGITVCEGRSYIKAKVRVFNTTSVPQPFMWWANTAVQISDSTRVVFPPDVEYVNDHDRRAVLSWPIAKGVYHTARPYDFGDGTDIHKISNIRVPSSYLVSKGQSDFDFVSTVDGENDEGMVTIADHFTSPGKKLWHWGNHKFGDKWCSNLTDDGSKYIEIMTGCYTDNQPDFTWLMPGESREFEQYWYPIHGIGEVKCANTEAAINLEKKENGSLFLGVISTAVRRGVVLRIRNGAETVWEQTADLTPETPFTAEVEGVTAPLTDLTFALIENGRALLTYKTPVRGKKKPISPRLPALPPQDIPTVEELYLNGRHLQQYRHFAAEPTDYFLEALRRDPGDSRSNEAMGFVRLAEGRFAEAISYFDVAEKRITLRNFNPEDTSFYYGRGLAKLYLNDIDGAYRDFYNAAWNNSYASPAYLELARIDLIRGDRELAVEHLKTCLKYNGENLDALELLADAAGDKEALAKRKALDPLYEEGTRRVEYVLDRAIRQMKAGNKAKALSILSEAEREDPMICYYRAYLTGDVSQVTAGDNLPWAYCFPSRLEDIAVLKAAGTARAHYYLGCLYYDKRRYADAAAEWEASVSMDKSFGPAYRNLGLAKFDHGKDFAGAEKALRKALALMPESSQTFFELVQLYKNGGKSAADRLALHEEFEALSLSRDDATLDRSVLLTVLGRYEEAKNILLGHSFHTYEGGEGNLTRHHALLHWIRGNEALKAGDGALAKKEFTEGFTFPLCYGEEKNYFAQEMHLFYGLGLAAELSGDKTEAAKQFALGSTDTAAPTELSWFRAECLKKLGKTEEAEALLSEMVRLGEEKIANRFRPDYYGVGSPCPAPFELDRDRINEIKGSVTAAFGYLGKGEISKAEEKMARVKELDETNISLLIYSLVKG